MKTGIVILSLAALLGLAATQAFATGPCGARPCAGTPCTGAAVDQEAVEQYQQFLDQTADLRRQLALDSAELTAVMNQDDPDQGQVRALAERIYDAKEAIRAKADELGITGGGAICPGAGCGSVNGVQGTRCDGLIEQKNG